MPRNRSIRSQRKTIRCWQKSRSVAIFCVPCWSTASSRTTPVAIEPRMSVERPLADLRFEPWIGDSAARGNQELCQNIQWSETFAANGRTENITSSERYKPHRRLFCNPRSPGGYSIHHCGRVSRGGFIFARPSVKPGQVVPQEPARLRRGDHHPIPRRSALESRISHPGKDGNQYRGRPARVARK